MFVTQKNKIKKKLTTAQVYAELPVWKTMVRVGAPALLTSFMTALFTFVDMLLLVNLMPLTSNFDFAHLFISKNIFNNLIDSITISGNSSITKQQLEEYILHNNINYENFVDYVAVVNHLHFYNTASIVRVASSLVSPLTFLITAITGLLLPGGNTLYSKAISTKNHLKQIKVWQNEFFASLIVTFSGMLVIYILNYTMIQSMVGDSVESNITELKNSQNGIYYFNLNKGIITFLSPNSDGKYVIYSDTISTNSYTLSGQFTINNNSSNSNIIIKDYVNYYNCVKNYAVLWAQRFVAIMTSALWISCLVRMNVNIIRATGRTSIITIIMVSDTILNIFLDYILIYYGQIGMDGAAVATLISWICALIPLIIYFNVLRKEGIIRISYAHLIFSRVMLDKTIISQMMLISSSYLISILGYLVVRVLLINQISYVTGELYPQLGNLYFISITGAVYPIMNLFQNTVSGFTNAGTSIFAYNLGIKRYDRLRIIIVEFILYIVVTGFIIEGIFGFCDPASTWILSLFKIHYAAGYNSYAYLYECARKFLWISLLILPFQGIGNAGFMIFRTTKRYISAGFIAAMRALIIITVYLYIFSSLAIHGVMPVEHVEMNGKDLSTIDPMYNQNMWLVLWSQTSSTITSNLIVLIWIIFYMIYGIKREKTKFIDWKISKFIKKKIEKNIYKEHLF